MTKDFSSEISQKISDRHLVYIGKLHSRNDINDLQQGVKSIFQTYQVAAKQREHRLFPIRKVRRNGREIWKPAAAAICQRDVVRTPESSVWESVHVKKKDEKVSAHNVIRCKSKHLCPLCRPVLLREYGKKLEELRKICEKGKCKTYMLTFTFQHTKGDSLQYGVDLLKNSFRWLNGRRFFQEKLRPQFFGYVSTIEVTWGERNGWHPHLHVLLFVHPEIVDGNLEFIDRYDLHKKLDHLWSNSLARNGYQGDYYAYHKDDDFEFTTIKVTECHDASYLSKWSLGTELSSSHKTGKRSDRFSLVQLERQLLVKNGGGDWVHPILKEYYDVMHNVHLHNPSRFGYGFPKLRKEIFAKVDEDKVLEGEEKKLLCFVLEESWKDMLAENHVAPFFSMLSDGVSPEEAVKKLGYPEHVVFGYSDETDRVKIRSP